VPRMLAAVTAMLILIPLFALLIILGRGIFR
jgi:hypothetical protein